MKIMFKHPSLTGGRAVDVSKGFTLHEFDIDQVCVFDMPGVGLVSLEQVREALGERAVGLTDDDLLVSKWRVKSPTEDREYLLRDFRVKEADSEPSA